MVRRTIGDLFTLAKGRKAVEVYSECVPGASRYIQIEDLRTDNDLKFAIDPVGTAVVPEDICIAWDGANAGTVGYGLDGLIGSTIARLRPINETQVFTPYFARYLQSQFKVLNQATAGATIPHVSRDKLMGLSPVLPDYAEQRRIAVTLDKADAIRKKRREALMLADEFLHSTFFELFGDSINNERRWKQSTLGEIAPGRGEIVDGPFGSSLKPDQYVDEGVRVIRNFNVRPGYFDPSAYKYVTTEKFEEIRRSEVREGDLLLSTKGTVGNVCLMPYLDGPSVLSATGTVRIRISSPHVDSVFLMHQMLTPQYQRHIEKSQSGAVQQYLNLSGIRDLPIILPPLVLQRKFSEIVKRKDMLSAKLQGGIQEAETLFASLAHRAFNGQL